MHDEIEGRKMVVYIYSSKNKELKTQDKQT